MTLRLIIIMVPPLVVTTLAVMTQRRRSGALARGGHGRLLRSHAALGKRAAGARLGRGVTHDQAQGRAPLRRVGQLHTTTTTTRVNSQPGVVALRRFRWLPAAAHSWRPQADHTAGRITSTRGLTGLAPLRSASVVEAPLPLEPLWPFLLSEDPLPLLAPAWGLASTLWAACQTTMGTAVEDALQDAARSGST